MSNLQPWPGPCGQPQLLQGYNKSFSATMTASASCLALPSGTCVGTGSASGSLTMSGTINNGMPYDPGPSPPNYVPTPNYNLLFKCCPSAGLEQYTFPSGEEIRLSFANQPATSCFVPGTGTSSSNISLQCVNCVNIAGIDYFVFSVGGGITEATGSQVINVPVLGGSGSATITSHGLACARDPTGLLFNATVSLSVTVT